MYELNICQWGRIIEIWVILKNPECIISVYSATCTSIIAIPLSALLDFEQLTLIK